MTLLARFRGWSTSQPRRTATWYARSQRNHGDQGRQQIGAGRHLDHVLRLRGDTAVARVDDGDDLTVAGQDFLDVAEHTIEEPSREASATTAVDRR